MVVLFFTPLLRYMPKPVMAAIIIVAVSKMADFAEFYHIWQQRKAEVALWLMPFLGTLVIGIDAGLLGSLVVCVLLVINHASLAHATLQAALQHTLRHCNTATLQHCNTATLQHCNTATLQHPHTAQQKHTHHAHTNTHTHTRTTLTCPHAHMHTRTHAHIHMT